MRCSSCLEISRITVIWNFLLFFSLKMIRNSSRQVRQLYAYVANESTRRLVEDGMSTELTNTHTARGFSALYHVFARKQRILCSALRHKRYLTLPYVTWLWDSFCFGTFACGFIWLPPRSLASSRGCSLTITNRNQLFVIYAKYWNGTNRGRDYF